MTEETTATPEVIEAPVTEPSQPSQPEAKPLTHAEQVHAAQRSAFERYAVDTGFVVPTNYKSAGTYFDALMSSQARMTQATTEAAELRRKADELEAQLKATSSEEVTPDTTPDPVDPNAELRIAIEEATPDAPTEGIAPAVTEDDMDKWRMELTTTNDLSVETREAIKSKLGPMSDTIINTFIEGEKSRRREAFQKADSVLGGGGKLSKIFEWAGKTFSPEQQAEINASLASPAWEITVRGLSAQFEQANATAKKAEPAATKQQVPVSATTPTSPDVKPFSTQTEFLAYRNDPRFQADADFRDHVMKRIAQTGNVTSLPKHL